MRNACFAWTVFCAGAVFAMALFDAMEGRFSPMWGSLIIILGVAAQNYPKETKE